MHNERLASEISQVKTASNLRESPIGITRWKLIEKELAYIAGIVDGEGHIGLSRNRTKKQRQQNPKYQTDISIFNTDIRLMNWLQKRLGGKIMVRNQSLHSEIWKTSYRWRIAESQQSQFLQLILPYLVIKKRQAELIIEYWSVKTKQYREGRKWRMDENEMAKREFYYHELRKLNARGKDGYQQRLSEAAPQKEGDAIVRTTEQSVELGRNVQVP